jgi:hypothetical protein
MSRPRLRLTGPAASHRTCTDAASWGDRIGTTEARENDLTGPSLTEDERGAGAEDQPNQRAIENSTSEVRAALKR